MNQIKGSTKEKLAGLIQKNNPFSKLVEKSYSYFKVAFKSGKGIKPNESAEVVTRDALSWLENNKQDNFFLWVHYMDVHTPYFSPKKYREEFAPDVSTREMYYLDIKLQRALRKEATLLPEEIQKLRRLYDATIKYVDDHVQKIVDFLEQHHLKEETIIIITSDHGEEFGEHGEFYHLSKPFDINLKVPLIFSHNVNADPEKLISLIDLPPTITALLHLPPHKTWNGMDILSHHRSCIYFENRHNEDRRIIDEFTKNRTEYFLKGIRTKRFKYIQDDLEGELLFDLQKDPTEQKNIASSIQYKEVKEKLQQVFHNLTKTQERMKKQENAMESNPSLSEYQDVVRERLSKLGYH